MREIEAFVRDFYEVNFFATGRAPSRASRAREER